MATLADSLVSSSSRRLFMYKRPDLVARLQRYQGRSYWIVKDPVGLNYYRFQEEEYYILQELDGNTSLDELKARFEAHFPPQKISVEELQQFLGTLHRSGLIVANLPGQGIQLKKRRDERRKKEILSALTNVLAIRFKGIDPDRLLTRMYPWVRWIFSRPAVYAALLLAFSALMLVTVQFDVFQSKLPSFHQFFNLKNILMLSLAMGLTKVIHEFGHGMTCKHFGGECHEMGVMILVLTPCLYCNVSDSWMLPNKWQRAMIGAAGMYVEIVIASICTFVWWFSSPGVLHYLCLSTMFVCSVSTLIFNGNPLLRYDGYYILSDVLEIPNLRQKASSILMRKLGEWCLGLEPPDDPFLPQQHQALFAVYSVAAGIYKWIVTFSIAWFLYEFWKPYRLEVIGQAILSVSLYGLLVHPLWRLGKFFYVPGRIDKVKKVRFFSTLGVVTAVVAGVLLIPFPYRVVCNFEVKLHQAEPVYVEIPGTLERIHVRAGDQVPAGKLLAQLQDPELQLEIAELDGQYRQQEEIVKGLAAMQYHDPKAKDALPGARKTLEYLKAMLAEKETELDRLHIVAPVAGTVMPPPFIPKPPESDPQLPTWYDTPLEEKNIGAYLKETSLFCHIGDPQNLVASLVIDQGDIDFIQEKQEVEIQLEQYPGEILSGKISQIAPFELQVSSRQLSNKSGGALSTKTDESGVERPLSTSYEARVPLDPTHNKHLRVGLTGQAKIHAGSLTLGSRLWRLLSQTFHFKM